MHVGIGTIQLLIPESRSLKDKRHVIKSMIDRVKNRFNVSIAEVDQLDAHQRSTIGIAVISNESRHAHAMLTKVIDFISQTHLAQLIDFEIEVIY